MAIVPSLSFDNNKNINLGFSKKIVKIENETIEAHGGKQWVFIGLDTVAGYLKIGVRASISDTSLQNKDISAFAVKMNIIYSLYEDDPETGIDESATDTYETVCFYPKYIHENNNKADQTIISVEGKINAIEMIVENNEDEDIDLEKLYIWPGNVDSVTEEAAVNSLNSYVKRDGYNTAGSSLTQLNIVIPELSSIEEASNLPNGAMFILRG